MKEKKEDSSAKQSQREKKAIEERERDRKRGTSVRCGGRQVSGCARFTLAFANGDTSRRKGERMSLFSSRDEEERGRAGRRARKKEKRAGAREDLPRRKESPGTLYWHYPFCS